MAEEEKDATKADESTDSKAPGKKSDLMTYIVVGVGALLVTIGVMYALMDTAPSGEGHADATNEESGSSSAKKDETAHGDDHSGKKDTENHAPDLFAELEDLSFLDDTNFVDEAGENTHKLKNALDGKSSGKRISKKDSIKAMDWITAEKKKITEERTELDKLKKRLDAQEHTIDQKLRQVDQAEAGRLNSLAKLYDGMKPDQVARMVAKLEDNTIVSILPRMKPANASKILGLMPPARGARISKKMITLAGK